LRHALAQMYEWVDALAPDIIQQKEELSQRQDGRCLDCMKRRKLYFARENSVLVGVCINCQDLRRVNRSTR
jgi:hypothetical protein